MLNFDLYKLTNPKSQEDIKVLLKEALIEINIVNQYLDKILSKDIDS